MENALMALHERINASLKKKGGGAKYFATSRRGEGAELQSDLNGNDIAKQKSAVKRVIANMTMGKDVSFLFVEIVKLGQTTNLELKKLVYLYILNTAKLQPEKAILAVNTFLHDAQSSSPIVRALAVRSMMCIRVSSVVDYTLEALRQKVRDPDPYVRKTVAIGIGKLFHHNMDLFYEHNFLDELMTLLRDSNATVVANATAVLCEVNDYGSNKEALKLDPDMVPRLLLVLGDCTEWGQQYILELLASIRPPDESSAEGLVERILPRLSHTNPSVVLGCIKVIANVVNRCSAAAVERYSIRVSSALQTIVKSEPEMLYAVFKNIHALLVIFPNLLRNDLAAFYVRFNDPAYIKLEKLKLLLKLVTPANAESVVNDLAEYTLEVDPLFVQEVVSTISAVAIKIEAVSMKCAELLMRVVERRPELLPRVTTAAKDIVRCYPDLLLLEPLVVQYGADSVVDEDAKVSLVWMLGEYSDFVESGPAILQTYIDTLESQEQPVQLGILTAVVKMYLRDPTATEATLYDVLERIKAHSLDPDLRDRAFAYWRMLSGGMGIEAMKSVVHGDGEESAPVNVDHTFSDAMTMADLKKSINTAAVVFGQPYQSFLTPYGLDETDPLEEDEEDEEELAAEETAPSPPLAEAAPPEVPSAVAPSVAAPAAQSSPKFADPLEDLFGGGSVQPPSQSQPSPTPQPQRSTIDDLFS